MATLTSNLGDYAKNAPKAAAAALKATADDIVNLTQQLAPVDTGELRDSYRSHAISTDEIIVGTDTPYAPHVEYGTVHAAAQPHLTPAFRQAKETFRTRFQQILMATGGR